jgi:Fungal Zn(2)-Cys(6) binuclear cluster domain
MEPPPEASQPNQQSGNRLTPTDLNARSSSRSRDAYSTPEQTDNVAPTPAQQHQGYNTNAKVAIPRTRAGISHRYSRRVAKACESCRQRKTKCSGDTPVCRQCRELRVTCRYPDGMREKTKRYTERFLSLGLHASFIRREAIANS